MTVRLNHLVLESGNNLNKVLNDSKTKPPCIRKWHQSFPNKNLHWKNIFFKPIQSTMDCQLRWFQLRLLHRLIPTQRFLFICKLSESSLCNLCDTEEQTLIHLFWKCELVQNFWNRLLSWLNNHCQHTLNFHFSET
eukprot:TRINITY_DN58622_c0_g1_i1.p1 TRINITY_DN58622_c0_g1~~TRINITY_DN58622_c0_g1_i1.p1  ORF type:complete len:136 (-),score=2.62 TRINITY_DN58622_c0_g1_i1:38-445(-)